MALLLVLGMCINPITDRSNTYALDDDVTSPVGASLKLTVGNTNLTKQDARIGEVNYITTSVNVNAANVDGYKVYVQAAPGSSSVLRNDNTEVTGVGDGVATTDFGDNKWGYALDSTGASVENLAYTSVPENSATLNPAYSTKATAENKNFNLAFAAKFGSGATAGHYATNVLLSAVASANEIVGFNDLKLGFDSLTYMQDMTPEKCAAASIYETKQLIDRRDGKKYWITKLQDGNCWMSQNLDLDLTAEGLTSQYTDIGGNWSSVSTIKPTATQKTSVTSGTFNNINIADSYDPGDYIYVTPAEQHNCGSVSALNLCTNYGWMSTEGLTADTDPNFTAKMDNEAVNGTHYHVGNYYSWNAATAGTASNATWVANSSVSGSICPKGWQLPLSSTANNTVSGSFYNMLREYGVQSLVASTTTTYPFKIQLSPLFFTYGGSVSNGNLSNAGNQGNYWSATFTTASTAAGNLGSLNFATSVNASNNGARNIGMQVRCVARTETGTTMSDLTYMQDMTADVCSNSDIEETKQLIDKRDSKSYWVTKLRDKKCWMTQNLDIINKTISSEDSDMEEGSFTVPASSKSGFTETNAQVRKAYSDSTYGGYYNWYTATAGNGNSAFIGIASSSICPKGWKLPYHSNDFYPLSTGDQDRMTSFPYNFKLGGYINNSTLYSSGTEGYYWGSSTGDSSHANIILSLYLNGNGGIQSGHSMYRYYGANVRCVAR